MTIDVEIISVEQIKPSSPTPKHLKNFKLCILDQLIPAAYSPIVFFYLNHHHLQVLERLALLKKSLSETLTQFFPLAGTIVDDLSINCDDHGACFTTAKVKSCRLSEFLESPDLKSIATFLPCGLTSTGFCVTNIQASEFECGGIAIGVCVSHRVLDGTALSFFLKSWANASSGENVLIAPDFSASALFPAHDSLLKNAAMAMWGSLFKKGQFVTKRFVFDHSAISSIRGKASRVEAVSGFIWKSAMAASEKRVGYQKPSLLTHIVNLRRRAAAPNIPQHSLGNLIWVASTARVIPSEDDFEVAEKVRKSISRIDGEYVKKLGGEEGWKVMVKDLKEIEEVGGSGDVDHIGFTSWCRLGFYEVDFGWGRPVWVSSIDASAPYFMNLVLLNDTRFGDGIEAWVTMDEQEMSILECDQQFTAFASLNPSPLNIINWQ